MPSPAWCQYQIARFHVDALAIDGGISSAAFNNKADRRWGVSMRASDLARQKDLHRSDEVVRRRPAATKPWIE